MWKNQTPIYCCGNTNGTDTVEDSSTVPQMIKQDHRVTPQFLTKVASYPRDMKMYVYSETYTQT